jgi:hypothetical protein
VTVGAGGARQANKTSTTPTKPKKT